MDARSIAFVFYSGILVVVIALAPTLRAVVLVLTGPTVLPMLTSVDIVGVIVFLFGTGVALLPALGGVLGPAFIGHPFVAHTLMATDLSRSRVLARPLLVSIAALSALVALGCALLSGALLVAGRAAFGQAGAFVGAATCFAIIASVGWMVGQRLGRQRAWLASALLVGAVVCTGLFHGTSSLTPWGWVAMTYPGSAGSAWWPPLPLAALAALSVCLLPLLMRSTPGQGIIEQAVRWNTAVTTARGGDPAASFANFRALPQAFRSYVAVRRAMPLVVLFWRRDIVGAFRTPVRFTTAVLGLLGAGLLGSSIGAPSPGRIVLASVTTVVAFLASGALTDGLRHAAEAYGAPPLYGFSPLRLVALHCAQPLTTSVVAMGAGFALAQQGSAIALTLVGWSAGHATLLRVFDSAKGALSPTLLSPIPTPFGDLSAIVVLGWHLDALLLAGVTGSLVAMCAVTYPAAVTLGFALCGSAPIVWMTIRRFRRM